MTLTAKQYKDKVRGCWMGKNIGGTLGAPFECKRGVIDLDFYTQSMENGAAPNDDLDLQIVWLAAAEKYGRNVNAAVLGEYWLTYIVANWSEYGAGKNNLRKGILPPFSGLYNNHNKDSNGAWIRSEIWACLAPGHPEIAVRYAFEDASVDHWGEGVYAEIFCAAVESAAFAESDCRRLIDIGLSYIPDDCAIARAVRDAIACYEQGLDWKEARKRILIDFPASFGMYGGYQGRPTEPDVPCGKLGYDAPSNIGIMILGWLYGEGDFGRSICIAAGCMEDGDCTAGTLAAILGIISGEAALPEKWTAPIGKAIKTISLNLTNRLRVPRDTDELSGRVCALMPVFMAESCDTMNDDGVKLFLREGDALLAQPEYKMGVFVVKHPREQFALRMRSLFFENALFGVTLECRGGLNVREGEPLSFTLHIENYLRNQQWLRARWILPESWECSSGRQFSLCLDQYHGGYGETHVDLTVTPRSLDAGEFDAVLELCSEARPSRLFIPITLLNNPQRFNDPECTGVPLA